MYETFFGLKLAPFKITSDPTFLYWSKNHKIAETILEAGGEFLAPITVISGDVGTGKTTLLRQFLQNAPDDLKVGLISNFTSGLDDIHSWIANAFDLGRNGTTVDLFRTFERFLLTEYAAGRRCVLILDEAQNISDADLEALRLLTNINKGKDVLLLLFLIGQNELRARLSKPNNRQIAQRVGVAFELGPLSAEDTRNYVRHRLSVAGARREIFDDAALEQVYEVTHGIPRLINLVCDLALVTAFGDNVETIDGHFFQAFLQEAEDSGMLAHLTLPKHSAVPPPMQSEPAPIYSKLAKVEPFPPRGERGAAPPEAPEALPGNPTRPLVQNLPQPIVPERHPDAKDTGSPEAFGPAPVQERALGPDEAAEKPATSSKPPGATEPERGDTPQQQAPPEPGRAWSEDNPSIKTPDRVFETASDRPALPVVAKTVLMEPSQPTPPGRYTRHLKMAAVGGLALLAIVVPLKTLPPPPEQKPAQQDTVVVPPVHTETGDTGQSAERAALLRAPPEPEVVPLDNPEGAELMEQALEMGQSEPGAAALAYARAALRGEDRAAYYLGQLYETGAGVPQSTGLARAWYEHASDTVRSARRRLDRLGPSEVTGPLAPPVPVMGGPVVDGGSEFVWTVEAGADPGFYVVEVAADRTGAISRYAPETRSAMLVETLEPAGIWRVLSADPETARYAVSDWVPMGADPGPSSLGKDPVQPTAIVMVSSETALPEGVLASLTSAGISLETVERGAQDTQTAAVRYVYEDDRDHAERAAAALGGGIPVEQLAATDRTILPGQITITMAP